MSKAIPDVPLNTPFSHAHTPPFALVYPRWTAVLSRAVGGGAFLREILKRILLSPLSIPLRFATLLIGVASPRHGLEMLCTPFGQKLIGNGLSQWLIHQGKGKKAETCNMQRCYFACLLTSDLLGLTLSLTVFGALLDGRDAFTHGKRQFELYLGHTELTIERQRIKAELKQVWPLMDTLKRWCKVLKSDQKELDLAVWKQYCEQYTGGVDGCNSESFAMLLFILDNRFLAQRMTKKEFICTEAFSVLDAMQKNIALTKKIFRLAEAALVNAEEHPVLTWIDIVLEAKAHALANNLTQGIKNHFQGCQPTDVQLQALLTIETQKFRFHHVRLCLHQLTGSAQSNPAAKGWQKDSLINLVEGEMLDPLENVLLVCQRINQEYPDWFPEPLYVRNPANFSPRDIHFLKEEAIDYVQQKERFNRHAALLEHLKFSDAWQSVLEVNFASRLAAIASKPSVPNADPWQATSLSVHENFSRRCLSVRKEYPNQWTLLKVKAV